MPAIALAAGQAARAAQLLGAVPAALGDAACDLGRGLTLEDVAALALGDARDH